MRLRLRLAPWSSRKLARSVGAPWRLPLQRQHHQQMSRCFGAWSWRQALCTSKVGHAPCVCLRLAPWSSRKLARSVGGSWRLPLQRQRHLQVQVAGLGGKHALSTSRDEHAPCVGLRFAPWSSRKLARSVGASWRLPLQKQTICRCTCMVLTAGTLHNQRRARH